MSVENISVKEYYNQQNKTYNIITKFKHTFKIVNLDDFEIILKLSGEQNGQ